MRFRGLQGRWWASEGLGFQGCADLGFRVCGVQGFGLGD